MPLGTRNTHWWEGAVVWGRLRASDSWDPHHKHKEENNKTKQQYCIILWGFSSATYTSFFPKGLIIYRTSQNGLFPGLHSSPIMKPTQSMCHLNNDPKMLPWPTFSPPLILTVIPLRQDRGLACIWWSSPHRQPCLRPASCWVVGSHLCTILPVMGELAMLLHHTHHNKYVCNISSSLLWLLHYKPLTSVSVSEYSLTLSTETMLVSKSQVILTIQFREDVTYRGNK